ncbi:MAG: N-acyl homoserine lactonase family protein [Desulfobacterales bacterium]|nr:N-acyl homoserine lactonase family protein [Desulfobacterales bacterium]
MSNRITLLDLGNISVESSFLVFARDIGSQATVKTFSFLITGDQIDPILIDTGFTNLEIIKRLGMSVTQQEEQTIEKQLFNHGLKIKDIRYILHTHLHVDHAGNDYLFPMNTTKVIVNRRELEFSVSGIMGGVYPPENIKHLIDRLHADNSLGLLDLELTGPDEILPGIVCERAGGHTDGSMNILVETDEGTACICGDVLYNIHDQVIVPHLQNNFVEPQTSANRSTASREEKAAIKKVLRHDIILPSHDYPAKLKHGKVIGRYMETIPGPQVQTIDLPKL